MIFSKEQVSLVATSLVAYLRLNTPRSGATVLALSGDLGAGKTTLVQHIAAELGVKHTPLSPTFVIMRSYETNDPLFKQLVHIDAYRLEKESELGPLHLEDIFMKEGSLVCVEWPENVSVLLPKNTLRFKLRTVSENERELTGPEDWGVSLQKSN